MSRLHVRLREQEKACREFAAEMLELHRDIDLRVPVRFLQVRVRLLEMLVEQTGGSLLTQDFRVALADAKKRVVLRAEERRSNSRGLHVVRV